MKIFTIVSDKTIFNIYIITDDQQKYGVIIDPGDFSIYIYNFLKQIGANITKVILTDSDKKKTEGIPVLKKIYDVDIYAYRNIIYDYDTKVVRNGKEIIEGELVFKIIETPIYSFDAISILIEDSLFIGNAFQSGTLNRIKGGILNLDRYNTNNEEFSNREFELNVIKKHILTLPDHIIIYPSFGPESTLKIEKKINPYFKGINNG